MTHAIRVENFSAGPGLRAKFKQASGTCLFKIDRSLLKCPILLQLARITYVLQKAPPLRVPIPEEQIFED
jgi:hypothetical protein